MASLSNHATNNFVGDDSLNEKLKQSWSKGREHGLQEAAIKQARKEVADRRAMKVVIGVVVDVAPSVWDMETDGEMGMDMGGETEMNKEAEVEAERETNMEVVIWTPDTSNKDTDDEDTEESDLLDFGGPETDDFVVSEDDVHDKIMVESVNAMTLDTDVITFESESTNTTDRDLDSNIALIDSSLPETMASSDSIQLPANTTAAPTDPLPTRFGIPSASTIHPIEPNFFTTRTIPPYPFDDDINSESSVALLVGPISDPAFDAWKHDDGRQYIMGKVAGVFSTIFLRKAPGERYIRVEFHSQHMRDKALRVLGGVVDERQNSFFLKGGFPW
ncbi:hypothetical protein QBC40DRAFT_316008 [Triangularia verruculosa]|uniref:Uncharacterized protein n=1 Tax=Triangularia verruculosa TaxID=2587418 RepID=A0AAN6X8L1_9PEZI|nr:hypothetical protein QBC40DRAFT_316008 [Triangularia verruculosa]